MHKEIISESDEQALLDNTIRKKNIPVGGFGSNAFSAIQRYFKIFVSF